MTHDTERALIKALQKYWDEGNRACGMEDWARAILAAIRAEIAAANMRRACECEHCGQLNSIETSHCGHCDHKHNDIPAPPASADPVPEHLRKQGYRIGVARDPATPPADAADPYAREAFNKHHIQRVVVDSSHYVWLGWCAAMDYMRARKEEEGK